MQNEIQINQKLMEREDCLVEVFDLERQINAILGAPYPLAPPDELPSRQKRKKPPRRKAAAKKAALRLRKLDSESETAYRIAYTDHDVEHIEIHIDPRPLTTLLNTPLPHLSIRAIETVFPDENGAWQTVETLFRPDA